MVPRCLFLAEETENPTSVQVGQTVTLNPRRGAQDKEPWRSLDLAEITTQTVEAEHVYDVHLGETLVPYATLSPLKAVLPFRATDGQIPADDNDVGGVRVGGLERRMRDRWRTVSRLWDENKTTANKLNLLGQLDYYGKLSAQLDWQRDQAGRPVRVLYSGWGAPTAAILHDDNAVVDYKLFWVSCRDYRRGILSAVRHKQRHFGGRGQQIHHSQLGGEYTGSAEAPMEIADPLIRS